MTSIQLEECQSDLRSPCTYSKKCDNIIGLTYKVQQMPHDLCTSTLILLLGIPWNLFHHPEGTILDSFLQFNLLHVQHHVLIVVRSCVCVHACVHMSQFMYTIIMFVHAYLSCIG